MRIVAIDNEDDNNNDNNNKDNDKKDNDNKDNDRDNVDNILFGRSVRAESACPSKWSQRPWALHMADSSLTECFWKRVECTLAMHINGFFPAALSSSIVCLNEAKQVVSSSEGAMNLQQNIFFGTILKTLGCATL